MEIILLLDAEKKQRMYFKPAVYAFGLATIGEQSVIPDNVKIGRNTAISGITTAEDYPEGILESGQVIRAKDGEQS